MAKPKIKIYQVHSFSSSSYHLLQPFIICICIFLNPSLQLKFKTLFSCTQLCSHTTNLVPYLCFKRKAILNFFRLCSKKNHRPIEEPNFEHLFFVTLCFFSEWLSNGNAIFVHVNSNMPIKLFRDFSLIQFCPVLVCDQEVSTSIFFKAKIKILIFFMVLFIYQDFKRPLLSFP